MGSAFMGIPVYITSHICPLDGGLALLLDSPLNGGLELEGRFGSKK